MNEVAAKSKVVGMGAVEERPYIRVVFQSGLPQETGINGCRVDDVVTLALERLQMYQEGALACEENDEAIRHLRCALASLEERRARRRAQGVFNTFEQHQTIRTEDEEEDFSATSC